MIETSCEKCGRDTTGTDMYLGDWTGYYQKYYNAEYRYSRQMKVCGDCKKNFDAMEFSGGQVSFWPPRQNNPGRIVTFPFDSTNSRTSEYDPFLMGNFLCGMCYDEAPGIFLDCSGGEYGGSSLCFDCIQILTDWYKENVP